MAQKFNSIETELYTALKQGLPQIEDRIYPLVMPQDTKHDAVTFSFFSKRPRGSLGGCTWGEDSNVQIDIFCKDYIDSVKLSDEVIKVLKDSFTVSNLSTMDVFAKHTLKFRRIIDFKIL